MIYSFDKPLTPLKLSAFRPVKSSVRPASEKSPVINALDASLPVCVKRERSISIDVKG